MTYKEIKKAQLENKKLYDEKLIDIQEYAKRQSELLKEIKARIYKMENFEYEIFKNIMNWVKKKLRFS